MKGYSFFDIIGPIMIGPSSSHTAGAVKIALAARIISGIGFVKVNYYLAGSFAKTYLGHGTDRALIGGSLGFMPDDERIKEAFTHAQKYGLEYNFIPIEDPSLHANTVIIEMKYPDGTITKVTGCSLGGGSMKITDINGDKVNYTGHYATLVIRYPDAKFVISSITNILSNADVNIEHIQTSHSDHSMVTLVIELSEPIDSKFIREISELEPIDSVNFIPPLIIRR
ncbi:MAG: L-serine ammonia-lyase, iron-sulfur-dependent, subunit beta [Tissierellia bacterium]|nr:L-serine ammonia-lyase, iron-sulfur-dependent, subunit beta [Tissierellia bacterium]